MTGARGPGLLLLMALSWASPLFADDAPWELPPDIDQRVELGLRFFENAQLEDGSFTTPSLPSSVQYNCHTIFLYEYLGILEKKRSIVDALMARIWADQSAETGGFSGYPGGPKNVSIAIEAYLAARIAGEEETTERMRKLAAFIQAEGGIRKANFTVLPYLLLFGLDKRANCVPAFTLPIVMRMDARLPWLKVGIYPLLYMVQQGKLHRLPKERQPRAIMRRQLACPNWTPHPLRIFKFGKKKFFNWLTSHLSPDGTLFDYAPTTVPGLMALSTEGKKYQDRIEQGLEAIEKLQLDQNGLLMQTPSAPSTGETYLVMSALLDMGAAPEHPILKKGEEFLYRVQQPNTGAWGFTGNNRHFPDFDDTMNSLMPLHRLELLRQSKTRFPQLAQGVRWILDGQFKNGSFGTWDREEADGGRLKFLFRGPLEAGFVITQGVIEHTSRIALGLHGFRDEVPGSEEASLRALRWILTQQNEDGSFPGTWVLGFQHGTAMPLPLFGSRMQDPAVSSAAERALDFVLAHQREDGGWGESPDSYVEGRSIDLGVSSPALTGMISTLLMRFLREESYVHWEKLKPSLERAVAYLYSTQNTADGLWHDPAWTAVTFPKVEYLVYSYYQEISPLQALGMFPKIAAEALNRKPLEALP